MEHVYNMNNILLERVHIDTRHQKSAYKKSTNIGRLTAGPVQVLHLYGLIPILPHLFPFDRAYNVQKRPKNAFSRLTSIDCA